jgi:hypothetical protein
MFFFRPISCVLAGCDSAFGKDKLHVRKSAQPSSIIGQVRAIEHGSLCVNQKIGKNGLLFSLSWMETTKRHTRSPRCLERQINATERRKIEVDGLLGSAACREFGIRNRTRCQFIAAGASKQSVGAFRMVRVRAVQPRDDNRSIDQDHGRVLRSNSAPDTLPSHVPARSRMCLWTLFIFLHTRIDPSSCNVQLSGVAGPMPACRRIFGGIGLAPLEVTTVAISASAYGFDAGASNRSLAA